MQIKFKIRGRMREREREREREKYIQKHHKVNNLLIK